MLKQKNKTKLNIGLYGKFIILQIILWFFLIFIAISVRFSANYIVFLDNLAFTIANYFRNYITVNVFLIITFFGETSFILSLLILSVFILKKKSIPLIIFTSISAGLNIIIKHIITRARPVGQFVQNLIIYYPFPDGFSFPSGHSQNGLVFYFILVYLLNKYLFKYCKNKNLSQTLIVIFCILIMFSRIILGVHFFSDILAGLVLASIIISLFKFFEKTKPSTFYNKEY